MGLFKFYELGYRYASLTFLTNDQSDLSKVLSTYYRWWILEIKNCVRDNLHRILLRKDDESQIIADIMKFRNDLGISYDEEITPADIVRFKSLKIYSWLFTDFQFKLMPFLNKEDMETIKAIIEHCVIVGIDTICCMEEQVNDAVKYNEYIYILTSSILSRFDSMTMCGITMKLQRQFVAATFIQRKWRNASSNPAYSLCRKRILKEFIEFQQDIQKN